jgi:glycerol-3-phosphate dehydrogenase
MAALDFDPLWKIRLLGRYNARTADLLACAHEEELTRVEDTMTLWAELRFAAHAEQVVHLDDLLLRRTRLGTLLADGAMDEITRIRSICQPELGWDDERWQKEVSDYRALWQKSFQIPMGENLIAA